MRDCSAKGHLPIAGAVLADRFWQLQAEGQPASEESCEDLFPGKSCVGTVVCGNGMQGLSLHLEELCKG